MSPEQEYERMASREYQKVVEQEHAAQLSERKPVLEWVWIIEDQEYQCYDGGKELSVYGGAGDWEFYVNGTCSKSSFPTADAAKLACEDHLATLLEPIAATYEKLRGNR